VRLGPVGRREEAFAGQSRSFAERLVLRDEAGEVFGAIGAANQWWLPYDPLTNKSVHLFF
jgi:hypothetical protein